MERRILFWLFVLALGLRILYGATVGNPIGAPVSYELRLAQRIATGTEWLRTPYSPMAPGYPVTLAALYLVSFKQLWLTFFLQCVLASLTVVVMYGIAREFLTRLPATLAALWFGASVLHMQFTSFFTRDILAGLLFLSLLLVLVREFRRMLFSCVAGLLFAFLIHIDPQYILLFPLFAVFTLLFKTRHKLLNIQYFFVFAATAVVVSLPWTVRNDLVYGQPVPVALEATRYLRPLRMLRSDSETTAEGVGSRIEFARRTNRIGLNAVEFWRFARFAEGRSMQSDHEDTSILVEPAWSTRHNLISIASYGVLLPFFLLGIAFAVLRKNPVANMLAITAAAYFVMRTYLGGSERARLPVEPLVIMLAFYGAFELVALVSERRESGRTIDIPA